MRSAIPLGPTDSTPWAPLGTSGLMLKELNRDPSTGARTAFVTSPPRPGTERKAQFHASEEEFFCLEGRFTFDGEHWFRPGAYACFPAGVVHGAHVQVPVGYRLYLRTSGSTEAVRVPTPRSTQPYREDGRDDSPQALLIDTGWPDVPEQQTLRSIPGGAIDLKRMPAGAVLDTCAWHALPVEILLVSGTLGSNDRVLLPGAYGFYPLGEELPMLTALEDATILVHWGHWP